MDVGHILIHRCDVLTREADPGEVTTDPFGHPTPVGSLPEYEDAIGLNDVPCRLTPRTLRNREVYTAREGEVETLQYDLLFEPGTRIKNTDKIREVRDGEPDEDGQARVIAKNLDVWLVPASRFGYFEELVSIVVRAAD